MFLANTTPVCPISFQNFLVGLHRRHDQPQDCASTKTRNSTTEQAAQQIQALAASVEELTCQNEELRRATKSNNEEWQRTVENQNEEERRKIEGNHNEEELDNQVNRRTRASEENSSSMESKLRNMRREVDELRNAVKDRVVDYLDEIIRRTDSPFTTKVLNHPLPPKFHLPQLELFDGSRDPLDHIESFKTLMLL